MPILERFDLEECQLLLGVFINWIGDSSEAWLDNGQAAKAEYQAIINKLQTRMMVLRERGM